MTTKSLPSLSPKADSRLYETDSWLQEVYDGCITVLPAQPSTLRIDSSHSRLGNIDQLPPELQLLIIEQLDFRSLSRLMRTSRKGKTIVEGLAAFIDMIEHAPEVLTALGKTNIISHHSAASLRQVLRSQKCASCFDFGPLLFLPTCERICPTCVLYNDAFWMTTPSLAKECFSLSDDQLGTIPIMRVIPGAYGFWEYHCNLGPINRLVSAKQVKQLGLEIHGSEEALALLKPAPPPFVDISYIFTGDPVTSTEEAEADSYFERCSRHDFIQRIHSMKLEPPGRRLSSAGADYDSGDYFLGTAVCKFPSLSNSGPDFGYACGSCWTFSEEFWKLPNWRQLIPDSLKEFSKNEVWHHYQNASNVVHSEAEYSEHLEKCPGVPFQLAQLEKADEKLRSENITANDNYRDSEDGDDESTASGGSESQESTSNDVSEEED
ncbi:hypothetical protein CkaCkLH20_11694 [Colletotrichum karsti]|uniref:F-box domain-containing protein n=1 Tax=Colletotrichum karsti TaxID=1095194 RepID=A0A9P6LFP7_9PEZI|nr:uncharacterized protein CkaCkLH20_11694 [Colletotrichum karsti]KAF9870795.1 hypothetical protein CkaCkLH20_11694 [Colletotrichum karsti]